MSNLHDHNIADQTGADFRTDLNNVLGDIQSTNAGPNEPTTKVAYKIWLDTTNNRVKIRNGANNAWIDLGSATAELGHATSASPSLTGTVNSAGDIVCNSNGRIKLPVGTTGQRPSSPTTGDTRYNSTLNRQEIYNGSDWVTGTVPSGGSANNVIKNDGSGGVSWDTVEALLGFPSQSGNGGKTLTTNGSALSWAALASSSHTRFDYTGSSQTWTKPSTGSLVIICCWGGGGGGSKRGGGVNFQGGGGGAGGLFITPLSSLTDASYTVTVGIGGAAGGSNGTTGGNSSFGSLITAYGGERGRQGGAGGRGGGFGGRGPSYMGGERSTAYSASGDDSTFTAYTQPTSAVFGGGGGGGGAEGGGMPGAPSVFGGGGGGSRENSGSGHAGGISVMGGAGGAGASSSGGNATDGSVPGGGGGAAYNGTPGDGGHGRVDVYVV